MSFEQVISWESIRSITLFCFLGAFFLTFLKYILFGHEVSNKGVQKIIGGLCVFVVAIISNNPFVFWTALFIGGLIIASEEFMKALAAIIKSRNDKVADTVAALDYREATEREVTKKQKEEAVDLVRPLVVARDASGEVEKARKRTDVEERFKRIRRIEEIALDYFSERYGSSFVKHVKLDSDTDEEVIVDGIFIDSSEKVKALVELHYLANPAFLKNHLVRSLGRLRLFFPDLKVVFGVILDKDCGEIKPRHLEFLSKFEKVSLYIFRMDGDKIQLENTIVHGV